MLALIMASEKEAEPIAELLENRVPKYGYGRTVYCGNMDNIPLGIVVSGVGKSNAAAAAQMAISDLKADAVINIGTAGALKNNVSLGEIYEITECVQHDFDLSKVNKTQTGTLDEYKKPFLALDTIERYTTAKITTGDRFIDNQTDCTSLVHAYDVDLCDMECGAIVHACKRAKIPIYAFKIVADCVYGTNPCVQFKKNRYIFLRQMLNKIKDVVIDVAKEETLFTYIGNGWDKLLSPLFSDKRYIILRRSLKKTRQRLRKNTPEIHICPDPEKIFEGFRKTPPEKIKCVIVVQDPYPNYKNATGVALCVPDDVNTPPGTLKTVLKKLGIDLNSSSLEDYFHNLIKWTDRGVLLLNAALTVTEKKPGSHQKRWSWFTDEVIKIISNTTVHTVFMLWGASAKSKEAFIDTTDKKHHIIKCDHPSPQKQNLSTTSTQPSNSGFMKCQIFNDANDYLVENGKHIEWDLRNC